MSKRRFTPNLKWPLQGGAMYTVILSNLDINNRKNRTLAEFWHWFVGNVPGNDIDSGEVILDLLHPLVLKGSNFQVGCIITNVHVHNIAHTSSNIQSCTKRFLLGSDN